MAAPDIRPNLSNWISTNFPKRLQENKRNRSMKLLVIIEITNS